MYTKILVALSANCSDAVLASAIEMSRKHDARILVVHAVDLAPCMVGEHDYGLQLVIEAMESHGREIVARAMRVLNEHGCPAESRLFTLPVSGATVGGAIASVADTAGADLILLGARKPGWWRWLSEDVASVVRRHTEAPIQTVSGSVAGASTSRAAARWTDATAANGR
jgi:nucleotide-binding universal stress UspA family protein